MAYKYDKSSYHIVEMADKVFAVLNNETGVAIEHINASISATKKSIETDILK